ncbi:motile sperm domain-containing protein 2-like [Culicoides brevitarsis]|uniref:motile sperm domain-containing protein 2-like n=1 Tax=Culicoides brevitarsis TaxID=469753 RepID=UPI00307B6485
MVLAEVKQVSGEQIRELRQRFAEKCENDGVPVKGGFHPADLARINDNDIWLTKFLQEKDLNVNEALNMLWETCIWRKEFGTNDITADNIRQDYRDAGLYFPHTSRDVDGKVLFMFRCKLYQRGSKDLDELKRVLVYWIERTIREQNGDLITPVFDMTDCGLSNIDLPYTQYIINVFKNYYPEQINYIIIYDMAWILNATFQVIKKLLPAKAVERLKFLNAKNVKEFVEKDNVPALWKGTNKYEYHWTPEKLPTTNGTADISSNNNKKVHFAPQSHTIEDSSPSDVTSHSLNSSSAMDKSQNVNNQDSHLLRVTPSEAIIFNKVENELYGQVQLTNIDPHPVTYKIKTTAPEKFRVRPSSGVLTKGGTQTINVFFNQGHTWNRDKFLVMCMSLGADASTDQQHVAELWKNTPSSSASIEQHRLRCQLPDDTKEGVKSGSVFDSFDSSSNRTQTQMNHTLTCITETLHRLEGQTRWTQTMQWVSCLLFIVLSVAIIYILKIEINNNSYEYCLKH